MSTSHVKESQRIGGLEKKCLEMTGLLSGTLFLTLLISLFLLLFTNN